MLVLEPKLSHIHVAIGPHSLLGGPVALQDVEYGFVEKAPSGSSDGTMQAECQCVTGSSSNLSTCSYHHKLILLLLPTADQHVMVQRALAGPQGNAKMKFAVIQRMSKFAGHEMGARMRQIVIAQFCFKQVIKVTVVGRLSPVSVSH